MGIWLRYKKKKADLLGVVGNIQILNVETERDQRDVELITKLLISQGLRGAETRGKGATDKRAGKVFYADAVKLYGLGEKNRSRRLNVTKNILQQKSSKIRERCG